MLLQVVKRGVGLLSSLSVFAQVGIACLAGIWVTNGVWRRKTVAGRSGAPRSFIRMQTLSSVCPGVWRNRSRHAGACGDRRVCDGSLTPLPIAPSPTSAAFRRIWQNQHCAAAFKDPFIFLETVNQHGTSLNEVFGYLRAFAESCGDARRTGTIGSCSRVAAIRAKTADSGAINIAPCCCMFSDDRKGESRHATKSGCQSIYLHG
jgi:hypothetical protein